MKKIFVFSTLLVSAMLMCVSCSNDDSFVNEMKEGESNVVSFRPLFPDAGKSARKAPSRITATEFESKDEIGVFAVDCSSGSKELKTSNYADNICYCFNGSNFVAVNESEAIKILDTNTAGLAYYAIYPYISNAGPTASFTLKSNQQSHSNYSLSDLCTSFGGPTTNQQVDLTFNHRLSNVVVVLQGDNLASKTVSMKTTNVQRTLQMNLNANTFVAQGNKGEILMNNPSTNTYQCIIAPQDIANGTQLFVATIDGKEYTWSLTSAASFKSGKQYSYTLEVKGDKLVAISGTINPWDSDETGTGGGDDNEYQSEKMESDPALEVYVTAAERVGNNLIIDYTVKNVSGQDLNNLQFGTNYERALDEFGSNYYYYNAIGVGKYDNYNTSTKLRNGNTVTCHLKVTDYDSSNKAKAASCNIYVSADNYTFTNNKIEFYVDKITDNRPLAGGIQTCDRKLKFTLTRCKLNDEGDAIVEFTVQNLLSDDISGLTFGTYDKAKDDLNKSCYIYSSLNGSEYKSYITGAVIPANSTVQGSVMVKEPSEGAKNLNFNIDCSSTSYVMEESCVRFITIPIQ